MAYKCIYRFVCFVVNVVFVVIGCLYLHLILNLYFYRRTHFTFINYHYYFIIIFIYLVIMMEGAKAKNEKFNEIIQKLRIGF